MRYMNGAPLGADDIAEWLNDTLDEYYEPTGRASSPIRDDDLTVVDLDLWTGPINRVEVVFGCGRRFRFDVTEVTGG